jgi:hypothetical protein
MSQINEVQTILFVKKVPMSAILYENSCKPIYPSYLKIKMVQSFKPYCNLNSVLTVSLKFVHKL